MWRFILFLLTAGPLVAQVPIGETLTYKLTYVGIPAVTITLSVPEKTRLDGRDVVRLSAHAKTNVFFSAFYSLDNQYDTYVDAETGLPVTFTKTIAQKTLRQRMTTTYDQASHRAVYDGGKFDPAVDKPIREESHNFFSMIHCLRTRPLKEGFSQSFHLDVETEPWTVVAKVTGLETIHVAGRDRRAHKVVFEFTPTQEEVRRRKTDIVTRRVATSQSRLTFWIDTDAPCAFLQVAFELSPFNVYAALIEEEY